MSQRKLIPKLPNLIYIYEKIYTELHGLQDPVYVFFQQVTLRLTQVFF